VVKGLPSLAPGSPVGTSYLVFIDDFFPVAARRNEVLNALKDDLSRLGPEDRMALVAFDGRKLTMLSSWTSSQRDLAHAIQRALDRPAYGLNQVAERRSMLSGRRGINGPSGNPRSPYYDRLNVEEQSYAMELVGQLQREVDAAVSTVRAFAAPPGRKVMLLLSGGWPYSPSDYVANDIGRPLVARDVPDGRAIFQPLSETANRIGYTLYPVDVPGLQFNGISAANNAPGMRNGGLDIRQHEVQGSLQFLAEETGGTPLLSSLRTAALQRVESDTRSYYWLGFTPAWQGNDKSHKVELAVLRPGLKVRSRTDFLDLSRKSEVSMMVESAMLFGGSSEGGALPVKVGTPVRSGRHEIELPLDLEIPADQVTFVPINGRYAAELELRVAALDERGGRSEIPVIPIALAAQQQPQAGQTLHYATKLKLRRINQEVTIAVFDPLSGKILLAEKQVKP